MYNPETLTTLGTQGTGQINVIENRMENPEKLTTCVHMTQYDDKQSKNTTQYVLNTTILKKH